LRLRLPLSSKATRSDLTNIINAGQYMLLSLFILAVVVNYIGICLS
jgi:hypothetical protein